MNPSAVLLIGMSLAPSQAPSSSPAPFNPVASATFSTNVYAPLGGGFSQPAGPAAASGGHRSQPQFVSATVQPAGSWATTAGPGSGCRSPQSCDCGPANACCDSHAGRCGCDHELGCGNGLFGDDDDDVSCCGCRSTCDLYPHYAYAPANHGYYYFRPYNYTHVLQHQQTVQRLGGDARAPYATEMFNGIYQSYMAGGYVEMPFPSVLSPDYEEQRLPDLQGLLGQ